MKIVRGTKNISSPFLYPVVTLGNFDGVHVGHQILFKKAAEIARENRGTSIASTFEPHPLKIIAPDKVPPLLTHFHKKWNSLQLAKLIVLFVLILPDNLQISVRETFQKIF